MNLSSPTSLDEIKKRQVRRQNKILSSQLKKTGQKKNGTESSKGPNKEQELSSAMEKTYITNDLGLTDSDSQRPVTPDIPSKSKSSSDFEDDILMDCDK